MPKQPRRPPKDLATALARRGEAGGQNLPASASMIDAAHYIAEFSAELSSLARQSRLDLLAYLLDMARLEATRVKQGISE